MAQPFQVPLFGAGPMLDDHGLDDFDDDFLIPEPMTFALGGDVPLQSPTAHAQLDSSGLSSTNNRFTTSSDAFGAYETEGWDNAPPAHSADARVASSARLPLAPATDAGAAAHVGPDKLGELPEGSTRTKRNSARAASARIHAVIEADRVPARPKGRGAHDGPEASAAAAAQPAAGSSAPAKATGRKAAGNASQAAAVAAASASAPAAGAPAVSHASGGHLGHGHSQGHAHAHAHGHDGMGDDSDDHDDDSMDDDDDDEDGEGAGSKRKRRPGEPEDRLARSRERNRVHARKSRLRKKFFVDSLKSNLDGLEAENRRLRAFLEAKTGCTYEQLLEEEGSGTAGSGAQATARQPDVSPAGSSATSGAGSSGGPSLLAGPGQQPSAMLEGGDYALMEALTRSQQNFVISDPNMPDNPIVFASAGFYELTGFGPEEVIGRNCRFLQGPRTDPEAIAAIRRSIAAGHDCAVCLINYKKDGTPFWNRFFVAPLRGVDGKVVNFVGVQCEVKPSVASALLTMQGGAHKEFNTQGQAGKDQAAAGGQPAVIPAAALGGVPQAVLPGYGHAAHSAPSSSAASSTAAASGTSHKRR